MGSGCFALRVLCVKFRDAAVRCRHCALTNEEMLMQDLSFPMPAIDGVSIAWQGRNYLRPEVLLDFISVTQMPLTAVIPVAVLYSTVGVTQVLDLRKIPVKVANKVTYPISSQMLPCLYAKLIINAVTQRLRFQGYFVGKNEEHPTASSTLIGVALAFTVSPDNAELSAGTDPLSEWVI
jgi:hypothetical protein